MDGFSDPITWSRNYDEEEYEEDFEVELPKVEFVVTDHGKTLLEQGKLKTKKLLIGTRIAASALLHSVFPQLTLLGEVKIEGITTSVVDLRQHHLNHKTNKLYSIEGAERDSTGSFETLIFVSQASSFEALPRLVKSLFSAVSAEEAFIFDTLPASTYLAGVRQAVPTMRALKTSHASTTPQSPFLESPALVEGFTAAVLQHCQINSVAATAYISLEDDLYLESATVKAFVPIVKSLATTDSSKAVDIESLLKKVVSRRPNPLFA